MDWLSLKNIVRRTRTPVIVTDEEGEPLIVLPLSLYQGTATEVPEARREPPVRPPVEPVKPQKSERRSLLEEISGEVSEPKDQPVTQWEAPPQVESVMLKIPPQGVSEGEISLEESFIFMQ